MYKSGLLFACLPLAVLSCGGADDPAIENEEEVITEFTYRLTPDGGGNQVVLVFSDPDGDGGQAPTTEVSGSLQQNTAYGGVIEAGNLSDPAESCRYRR